MMRIISLFIRLAYIGYIFDSLEYVAMARFEVWGYRDNGFSAVKNMPSNEYIVMPCHSRFIITKLDSLSL